MATLASQALQSNRTFTFTDHGQQTEAVTLLWIALSLTLLALVFGLLYITFKYTRRFCTRTKRQPSGFALINDMEVEDIESGEHHADSVCTHEHPEQEPLQDRQRITAMQNIGDVYHYLQSCAVPQCNLVFGIDYTASNNHKGRRSFGGLSLHDIDLAGTRLNPYQHVIRILGSALDAYNTNKTMPAFGFGNHESGNQSAFELLDPDTEKSTKNYERVLLAYAEYTPKLIFAGPTSFAPVIRETIAISCCVPWHYFVLAIITDGDLIDVKETELYLASASYHPISILVVGVGDGPWDTMAKYCADPGAKRCFNNFRFVHYDGKTTDVEFALNALAHIPSQYKIIKQKGLLARNPRIPSQLSDTPPDSTHCANNTPTTQ
jgi:E3 ubiquitin-protein ligase RGLG